MPIKIDYLVVGAGIACTQSYMHGGAVMWPEGRRFAAVP
jgi:hypothetical protein